MNSKQLAELDKQLTTDVTLVKPPEKTPATFPKPASSEGIHSGDDNRQQPTMSDLWRKTKQNNRKRQENAQSDINHCGVGNNSQQKPSIHNEAAAARSQNLFPVNRSEANKRKVNQIPTALKALHADPSVTNDDSSSHYGPKPSESYKAKLAPTILRSKKGAPPPEKMPAEIGSTGTRESARNTVILSDDDTSLAEAQVVYESRFDKTTPNICDTSKQNSRHIMKSQKIEANGSKVK